MIVGQITVSKASGLLGDLCVKLANARQIATAVLTIDLIVVVRCLAYFDLVSTIAVRAVQCNTVVHRSAPLAS